MLCYRAEFRSQLKASYVSSHTDELKYNENETVCLWSTIHMLPLPRVEHSHERINGCFSRNAKPFYQIEHSVVVSV